LDVGKKPRVLYATDGKGTGKVKTVPIIYEIEDDTLKLCWDSKEGKALPRGLATRPGSGMILFTFKRERVALAAPPARDD